MIVIYFDFPVFPFRFHRLHDDGGVFIRTILCHTVQKIGHTGNAHGVVDGEHFFTERIRYGIFAFDLKIGQPLFRFPIG